jgi:hypothetical protein
MPIRGRRQKSRQQRRPVDTLTREIAQSNRRRREAILKDSAAHQRYVAFVDVLGFAGAVEASPHTSELLLSELYRESLEESIPSEPRSPNPRVYRTFLEFNRIITMIFRDSVYAARLRFPIDVVQFSDSAFLSCSRIEELLIACGFVFHQCIRADIPVRIGVGYGTWVSWHFASATWSKRFFHSAQFFGTGVVRAHAAESCKLKGLRILVHESAVQEVRKKFNRLPDWLLPVPLRETREKHTAHELNYLRAALDDHVTVKGRGTKQIESSEVMSHLYKLLCTDRVILAHLRRMEGKASALYAQHYRRTLKAIERMRHILQSSGGLQSP